MKKIIRIVSAILIGTVNAVVGACGGIIAVESLRYIGISQKKAHATAISIILPLSVISVIMYLYKGYVNLTDSLLYIIPGTIGAVVGAELLVKIKNNLLNKAFAVFMIYSGVRMFLR